MEPQAKTADDKLRADTSVEVKESDENVKAPTLAKEPEKGLFIYIGNLPPDATVEQVEEVLKKFGPIKHGGIQVTEGLCFGSVEYESLSSVQKALEASVLIREYKAIIWRKNTRMDEKGEGSVSELMIKDITPKNQLAINPINTVFGDKWGNKSLLSWGIVVCRIAHRLSLSVDGDKALCASLFRKCLEVLVEPDHLVVCAYANEQIARFLLKSSGEELLTTESHLSGRALAVHHVSQAIGNMRCKRQLQDGPKTVKLSSNKEHVGLSNVNDFPPSDSAVLSTDHLEEKTAVYVDRTCACGDCDCIVMCDMEEWSSKLHPNLCKLFLLLGESYLALGQEYLNKNELSHALESVELACSAYGSVPRKEGSNFFSAYEILKREDGSRADLFWAKAWTLVGDIHFKHYKVIFYKEKISDKISDKELSMSSDVVEELKQLIQNSKSKNCPSCFLVNCTCTQQSTPRRKQSKLPLGERSALSHHEESLKGKRGGIFKYLQLLDSGVVFVSALYCCEEAVKALKGVVSPDLISVQKTIGLLNSMEGRRLLKNKDFGKAEETFNNALKVYEQVQKSSYIIHTYCNLGDVQLQKAKIDAAQIKNIKTAKDKFDKAMKFYKATYSELAKLEGAGDDSFDSLDRKVRRCIGDTYVQMGTLLAAENKGFPGLDKVNHAFDAFQEALSSYHSLDVERIAGTYRQLACYQALCCLRWFERELKNDTLERLEKCLFLAVGNFKKALELYYTPKGLITDDTLSSELFWTSTQQILLNMMSLLQKRKSESEVLKTKYDTIKNLYEMFLRNPRCQTLHDMHASSAGDSLVS